MKQRGFTLIELLIVVAILGLLASIVLVGLGGARARARDARRISDLRETQNALELYYSANGKYPAFTGTGQWDNMSGAITGGGLGISRMPKETLAGHAAYQYSTEGGSYQSYVLSAKLEQANPALTEEGEPDVTVNGIDCADPIYCVQL